MQLTAHDQSLFPDDPAPHRVRSAVAIAMGSAVPATASAVLVTGSGTTGVLTGAFTIACVAVAALII
ncbi:hypothetical protein [Rhodococcus maanshanensis]|uniref:Uncharacterized protein n=1 Tax=Rhodococcus maanshanensis TaxID=183556 RepID=A0A1H7MHW9_9NOCA|nr:hypothetical protein [Rhodococcus maanshanensis]SEL10679.1 hypothetical protein SAMN05444583_10617 [Rhodococcus maanshanensis]